MARRAADGQRGFVITLELVLIFTILGIGLLVGIVALRNAAFVWWAKKKSQTVWVYDSSNPVKVLGPARDFDEHETPRLFYIDRDVTDWGGRNYRAFIGVRDDRFTTRHRIFYTNSTDCGATALDGAAVEACITRPSDEDTDNRGVGVVGVTVEDGGGGTFSGTARIGLAGGQGYLYPLQGGALNGPTYGVGRDVGFADTLPDASTSGLPGTLYRQSLDACDSTQIRSVWTSQLVFSGLPCEVLPAGLTVEAAKCPVGQDTTLGDPCTSPADLRCVTTGECTNIPARACTTNTACTTQTTACADTGFPCTVAADCEGVCNDDFTTPCDSNADCGGGAQCVGDQGACTAFNPVGTCDITPLQCRCPGTGDNNPANDWIDTGANCCPPGSIETSPGQCSIADDGSMREAVPVQLGGENAFANLTPPFHVNLPPDPNSFFTIAPAGSEGGGFGPITGPFDPKDPTNMNFNVPPGGEGGPP